MVEVRALDQRGGGQRRADQDHGVLPELVVLHGRRQLVEPAAQQHLVGPAHPMTDDHRGLWRVTAGQQLVLQHLVARCRQVQRHRGAVPGELAHRLLGRHGGAAPLQPGEDQRLGHFGQGDLHLGGRRAGREGRNPRDRLVRQPQPVTQLALFRGRPIDCRVAGVDARDQQALVAGAFVQRGDVLQGRGGRVDQHRVRFVAGHDLGRDQRGRPDDDVGGGDHPGATHGDQVGRPRPGPHEDHLALGGRGAHSLFPRFPARCGTISTLVK